MRTEQFLSSIKNNTVDYTDYLNRISYKDKIKDDFAWVKSKVDYYDKYNNTAYWGDKYERLKRNYDLFFGKFNPEEYRSHFNMFGLDSAPLPVKLKHINIISTPIRELIGEEYRRPFNMQAVAINSEAISKKEADKLEMLKQYVYKSLMSPILQQLDQEFPEKDSSQEQAEAYNKKVEEMTPEYIQKYMQKSYKLPEEIAAQNLIAYYTRKLNLNYLFSQGMLDVQCAGEECYFVGIKNDSLVVEKTNPLYMTYIMHKDEIFTHKADAVIKEDFISAIDVITKYEEYLKEDEIKNILNNARNVPFLPARNSELLSEGYIRIDDMPNTSQYNLERQVRVAHVVFKTLKKILFITTLDEFGEIKEIIADETYKMIKGIDLAVEEAYITEYWEATKIDSDIYIKMQPLPGQYRDLDNPYEAYNCYYGIIYNKFDGQNIAPIDRAVQWQFLYDVMIMRMEEELGTNIGNVMVAVQKHIPKGWSPEKWFHFLKVTKVAMIEPDIDGLGTDPQYWKSISLSNQREVSFYVELLRFIEQNLIRSLGSNESRLGSQGASETVGNNQQSLIQSAHITEPEYIIHNILKQEVCTAIIEYTKYLLPNNPEKFSYIMDDLTIAAFTYDPEIMSLAKIGIFLSNSSMDNDILRLLRTETKAMIQNSGGDFRTVLEILTTNNVQAIKNLIEKHGEEMQQRKEAEMQQLKQMEDNKIAAAKELAETKMNWESEQNQLDREFRLKEAYIKAAGYASVEDVDSNQVPDIFEAAKFNAELGFKTHEANIKEREMGIRERELVENNMSEEKDRQIEREKMAVEREKIKAMKQNKSTKK